MEDSSLKCIVRCSSRKRRTTYLTQLITAKVTPYAACRNRSSWVSRYQWAQDSSHYFTNILFVFIYLFILLFRSYYIVLKERGITGYLIYRWLSSHMLHIHPRHVTLNLKFNIIFGFTNLEIEFSQNNGMRIS